MHWLRYEFKSGKGELAHASTGLWMPCLHLVERLAFGNRVYEVLCSNHMFVHNDGGIPP